LNIRGLDRAIGLVEPCLEYHPQARKAQLLVQGAVSADYAWTRAEVAEVVPREGQKRGSVENLTLVPATDGR